MRGEGADRKHLDTVVAISNRSIEAAEGDAELPAYHWIYFVLSPLFDIIEQRGLKKQPLLVVLSSYMNCYVSILHPIYTRCTWAGGTFLCFLRKVP